MLTAFPMFSGFLSKTSDAINIASSPYIPSTSTEDVTTGEENTTGSTTTMSTKTEYQTSNTRDDS
jgi:hypothetical protein